MVATVPMALILDTGVLLAYLDQRQSAHAAVDMALQGHGPPFLTVEPVLSELAYLLRRDGLSGALAVELVAEGALTVVPVLDRSATRVHELMQTYDSVPMALADACLVRLSELERTIPIATLDSDFRIYRRFRREPLPLVSLPASVQEDAAHYPID